MALTYTQVRDDERRLARLRNAQFIREVALRLATLGDNEIAAWVDERPGAGANLREDIVQALIDIRGIHDVLKPVADVEAWNRNRATQRRLINARA